MIHFDGNYTGDQRRMLMCTSRAGGRLAKAGGWMLQPAGLAGQTGFGGTGRGHPATEAIFLL